MENVQDVAAAVLGRVGQVETMKLQKLVYYCQAWCLAITDEPLFPKELLGFENGPVVDDLWQRHKGRRWVSSWHYGDADNLADASQRLVDLVCSTYGDLTGDDLSKLTHSELPWLEARSDLPEGAPGRARLSRSTMARYYREHARLGSRTAADLASGGVFRIKPMTADQMASLRIELDAIPGEFAGEPPYYPGDDYVGRGQFDVPADARSTPGLAAGRTRVRP